MCAFTLGTEVVIDREDGSKEAGHFFPIIERNTVIPASRTETFYTSRDNQRKLNVEVLQGESRFASNNLKLGDIEVEVPVGKMGEEGIEPTRYLSNEIYSLTRLLNGLLTQISCRKRLSL